MERHDRRLRRGHSTDPSNKSPTRTPRARSELVRCLERHARTWAPLNSTPRAAPKSSSNKHAPFPLRANPDTLPTSHDSSHANSARILTPCSQSPGSRRRILLDDRPDLPIVSRAVLLEEIVRVRLRGRLRVRLVEQRLDAQQYLFDCDCRLPALLFVQDGEADGARGVDVWVKERWNEFAWNTWLDARSREVGLSEVERTFWRLGWVFCKRIGQSAAAAGVSRFMPVGTHHLGT